MIQKFKYGFIIFALIFPLITLSACQTGNSRGYNNSSSRPPAAPAQQAPRILNAPAAPVISNTTQAQKNLPPVKVAILLPLSGQHKNLGDAMLKAAQMALFQIGHNNLELIPRDTKGTADGARDAARSAINAHAQLVLGPIFAANVRAAKPITQSARVNMIAFSTDWTLAGGNTFIMGFLPFDQVERVTKFAAKHGIRRVGVLTPSSDYGRVVSSAFQTLAPRNGITITGTTNFPTNTSNLAPIVSTFTRFEERKAANALNQTPFDAVLMPTGGQHARAIGSLLSHYDLPPRTVRRLGTGLLDEAALASENNLEGTWFAAPSPNSRRNFEQQFTNTYGHRAPRLSTLAFDATALSAVLAKRGFQNGNKPAFDKRSIASPNGFSGLDGIFRFRDNNTIERGLAVLEYRRGQIVVIDDAPKTFQQPTQNAQAAETKF